jgi:hypothetical protein
MATQGGASSWSRASATGEVYQHGRLGALTAVVARARRRPLRQTVEEAAAAMVARSLLAGRSPGGR